MALPANTLLKSGRYRLVKELNRGGTAIVYEAEDLQRKEHVALKVMSLPPDQVPIKLVQREVEFSCTITHPHIVRLLDVFVEQQRYVLVWELVAGMDLLDLMNRLGGRLSENVAAFYFVQLLKAVLFMHDNGFCHRDIKPENCMIDRRSQRLKLIDFGLSKHLDSAETMGIGTPDYMSPELLNYTARAHALHYPSGRTAAYDAAKLLTGHYPFGDTSARGSLLQTINNIRAGHMLPLPPSVSPECAELIAGLLQVDPDARTALPDLRTNAWLQEQSLSFAKSIGREDYVDMNSQGATVVEAPPLPLLEPCKEPQPCKDPQPGQGPQLCKDPQPGKEPQPCKDPQLGKDPQPCTELQSLSQQSLPPSPTNMANACSFRSLTGFLRRKNPAAGTGSV